MRVTFQVTAESVAHAMALDARFSDLPRPQHILSQTRWSAMRLTRESFAAYGRNGWPDDYATADYREAVRLLRQWGWWT